MNRDARFLADMVEACDLIAGYIAEGEEAFMTDVRTQDAVVRRLEIIGEASKNLSAEVKSKAPDEPWVRIRRMRDKIVHQYFGVDLEVMWMTASTVLPPFRETVLRLLAEIEGPASSEHEGD